MRVISGIAKGTKLSSIDSNKTRPTLDRVKEALFSILQAYINEETVVLDLFAGSGQIGIEFLSRGAKEITFCESNPQAVKIIYQNLHKTQFDKKSKVINKDYRKALKKIKEDGTKFNIIYIDPPYKLDLAVDSVKYIIDNNILDKDGLIIIETDEEEREIKELEKIDVQMCDLRKYGRVKLIFLRGKEQK